MPTGRIKSAQHAYAFLTDDAGVDRFFMRRDVRLATRALAPDEDLRAILRPGALVTFEPIAHERGARAVNVQVQAL